MFGTVVAEIALIEPPQEDPGVAQEAGPLDFATKRPAR